MSSDSDSSGLAGPCGRGRAGRRGRRPPASVRLSRSDSHPSRPLSWLAGLTGGASVRREKACRGPAAAGVEALPPSRSARRSRAAGGCHHRLFLALAGAARRHHVEAAAVMGDDAVEFGQRLDLVDDHLAHLRGALGGLLRHLEHAAAQLVAGGFELAVHLGSHLLHALHHRGELLGRTA